MALVDASLVKRSLRGIINFGEGGTSRYGSDSGGFIMTSDELASYQEEGEAYVLRKLATLYKVPLTSSINGGATLASFDSITRSNLQALLIDSTCVRIVSYALAQQGNSIQLRNYLVDLKARFEENMEISLQKDISGGVVYPAYPDLVLSEKYLTREQNPIPNRSTGSLNKYYDTIQLFRKF